MSALTDLSFTDTSVDFVIPSRRYVWTSLNYSPRSDKGQCPEWQLQVVLWQLRVRDVSVKGAKHWLIWWKSCNSLKSRECATVTNDLTSLIFPFRVRMSFSWFWLLVNWSSCHSLGKWMTEWADHLQQLLTAGKCPRSTHTVLTLVFLAQRRRRQHPGLNNLSVALCTSHQ